MTIDLPFDREHIWHPYTSIKHPLPTCPVVRAEGVLIQLEDGRQLIDGTASWWAAIHGYNHPHLNQAAHRQLEKMAHVMFGGLTHGPAVDLAKRLLAICPSGLDQVFLADSGSVSVEVALKMALQYWHAKGEPRSQFLTVRGGYHGDTFGAMSVCDPKGGMHAMWQGFLPKHLFADAPPAGFDLPWRDAHLDSVKDLLARHGQQVAAVILEPVMQGAGGMRFYSPLYLSHLRALCDDHGILLIFDEIATGFGRTGALFAADHCGISPDIMCVGKALSGGYLTLAATLCSKKLSDGLAQDGSGVLMHGPTFMGNPLACAVAVASLDLLETEAWRAQVRAIEAQMIEELAPAHNSSRVADVRVLGAVAVVEMKEPLDLETAQRQLVKRGVWIRPFGKLLYIMPAYIIKPDQLSLLCHAMIELSC